MSGSNQYLPYRAHDFVGDLEGLKVGHDFAAMDQGDARILTLKDSRILDDEGQYIICLVDLRTDSCLRG